jgi:hypothetical protein
MAYVAPQLREQVIQRARGCCEYCKTQQLIVIDMAIDHIIPEVAGGATTEDNLCFCCNGCNTYKQAFQTGTDPDTGSDTPLFNPRVDSWDEHFRWNRDKTQILGRTGVGRATINRLNINREIAVRARQQWADAGLHPPPD